MSKVKLYQFGPLENQESTSPFCVKVHYALRYKGVPFDVVNVASPIELRRLNSRGKLPVLDVDGFTIADSSDIIAYLEAHHPEPRLYPPESRARAAALLLEDWADESLYWHVLYERWQIENQFVQFADTVFRPVPAAMRPIVKLLFSRRTRAALRGQGLGRLTPTEQRAKLGMTLDWLDSMSNGQFLCGQDLSIADVAVAAQVSALNISITPVASAEVSKRTNLMRWLERTRERVAAA